MSLIFQLDPDLCGNPSKRQDLWVRTMTSIDPVFGKLIFFFLPLLLGKVEGENEFLCGDQQNFKQV